MKEIKGMWVTKRKDKVVLEVSMLKEPNLRFLLSFNQAKGLMLDLDNLIKRIERRLLLSNERKNGK